MIRLGLCCIFREAPIKFSRTTATVLLKLDKEEQTGKLSAICHHNATALEQAITYCIDHGIGAFRINSQILPLATHPDVGYDLKELPDGPAIINLFKACGEKAKKHNIRLSFHPDQFVILNSQRKDVVTSSITELRYQATVAEWVGADVINIHGGGAYGDKPTALSQLEKAIKRLPKRIHSKLTLENDDRIYTPEDLLPLCNRTGIPLCYDVHHHRCLPDSLTIEEATSAAIATWGGREPHFHLSSPLLAWSKKGNHRPHRDYINIRDFPACWMDKTLTIDVEAKAKEQAVMRLKKALFSQA